MHLTSCLFPIRVVNPYTKRIDYVPCGKCDYCKNSRSSIWVQRIRQESLCWNYCAFVTLTYDDAHVPSLYLDKDNKLVDPITGFTINPYDIEGFDLKSRLYLHRRKGIYYLRKEDTQLFMKRLRFYVSNLLRFTNESPQIRYYLCGEYGPSTFRPHYHLLLWFNSSTAASSFASLLCKAWSLGVVNWSFARDAASYVAQYLNCTCALPKVYLHKQIRPFSLASKCPPIGTLSIPTEEVSQIFHAGSVSRSIYNRKANRFDDVPLWRCTQDFLFPKISGFGELTHLDRVALYGISKFSSADTYSDFRAWFFNQLRVASSYGMPPVSHWQYLQRLQQRCTLKGRFSETPLKRLWSISRRVVLQSMLFNCSLDYYVSRIELYYSNKDYYRLKKQLEFEVDFVSQYHDCRPLVYIDPSYVERMFSRAVALETDMFAIDPIDNLILEGFGIDPLRFVCDKEYSSKLNPFNHPEYKKMFTDSTYIAKTNSKTKIKNDYLQLHPEYRVLHF